MAGSVAPLTLHPDGWSDWAARLIGPLAEGDPGGLSYVAAQVRAGRWELEAVRCGEARVGAVVWRVDRDPDGRALEIIYAAGMAPGRDLVAEVLPMFEARALSRDCVRLGFWTRRPGLIEKAAALGYGAPSFRMERALQ